MIKPIERAVRTVKEFKDAKFPEGMEVHIRLTPLKRSEERVRGSFLFPHHIGREQRVICFAEGQAGLEALDAGAIAVGGQDLADTEQELKEAIKQC